MRWEKSYCSRLVVSFDPLGFPKQSKTPSIPFFVKIVIFDGMQKYGLSTVVDKCHCQVDDCLKELTDTASCCNEISHRKVAHLLLLTDSPLLASAGPAGMTVVDMPNKTILHHNPWMPNVWTDLGWTQLCVKVPSKPLVFSCFLLPLLPNVER